MLCCCNILFQDGNESDAPPEYKNTTVKVLSNMKSFYCCWWYSNRKFSLLGQNIEVSDHLDGWPWKYSGENAMMLTTILIIELLPTHLLCSSP